VARRNKLTLNHANIGRVLTSNAMYAALEKKGEQVLQNVKDAAPVRTGRYRDSLHLERALTDRAVVRVVADVDYGLAVEANDAPMAVGLNRSRHA
jgi:hypothetical protein